MNLKELIETLELLPAELVVPDGFGTPHSYRGYYEQLAFEPESNTTAGAMLAHARSALGKTFTAYKGGDYTMDKETTVWIEKWGTAKGRCPGPSLVKALFSVKR